MCQPLSAGTVATHLGVGRRFQPGQAAQSPMVAPAAWQLDVCSLHVSILWQSQHRPTARSLAVSTPVGLKPSATCSSHARLQQQSLIGYAAFGKL